MKKRYYYHWRIRQWLRELFCRHEWHYISFSFTSYYECAKCEKRG